MFFSPPPPTHTHRTSCRFLWKVIFCEKTSLRWWSREFAAEPRKLFRKTGGLRSGSAGSPGVGERSGTERSNERERRADIATARGARARFLPARRNFLSSGRVFVFGRDVAFCVRNSIFLFFSRAEEEFFPCGLRFRGCALFLGRCNLQRMCFWRTGNFCRSKSRPGAEG